jgi:hypothetical protein
LNSIHGQRSATTYERTQDGHKAYKGRRRFDRDELAQKLDGINHHGAVSILASLAGIHRLLALNAKSGQLP